MKINYNASAAFVNSHLLRVENKMSKTMERLSSGLKINKAKDDPAGMAISEKMNVQIRGLDRASHNASDGISVIQIADGALNETTEILQRMRELSVQAANDAALCLEDKQAIQDEIETLKEEVDRISRDTEYNTKPLLDGSLDTRVFENSNPKLGASRMQISDQVEPGDYSVDITRPATQATVTTTGVDFTSTDPIGEDGSISINGVTVDVKATDTFADVYEKIRDAAEVAGINAERGEDGTVEFSTEKYGINATIEFTSNNEDLLNALNLAGDNNESVIEVGNGSYAFGTLDDGNVKFPQGQDMEAKLGDGFSDSATATYDGRRVTITDIGGVEFSFLVPESSDTLHESATGNFEFEVTDIGSMVLHIGANMDQEMDVRIPEVSTESLYIDDLNVVTAKGAGEAISRLDDAIAQTSAVRSSLGAYQNALESSVDSLDNYEENITSAYSKLTDMDIAEEMTNYAHQTVLDQAAISVLTQANEMPQQVLQILS